MRYLLASVIVVGCVACSSPLAPAPVPLCTIPSGPVTLRVAVVAHLSNRPLANVPAQLRAADCTPRPTTTNAAGIAEWQIPAGVYTIEVRSTAYFIDATVSASTQWLLSLPE